MKSVLFAAAVLAVASPAMGDVVVFSDSAMDPADYRTTVYANPGATTAVVQDVGRGPVGTSLGSSYSGTYGEFQSKQPARFQFLNDAFVYDPSALGAIDTIQASLWQNLFMRHNGQTVNLSNAEIQIRLLAEQDGALYEAAFRVGGSYVAGQWVQGSKNSIVASDFTLFDPSAPWAPRTLTGLDFAGGAITFGFEIAHFGLTGGAGADTVPASSNFRADDFELVLFTLDPVVNPPGNPGAVPEPSTWAMLILGFGAVGSTVRRRRSAFA
ncbi:MAG: hypothetical protein DI570_22350 [Phenylobacterium zucineum]|nr:MAG: hypothetical protein DI570_22350 [Phenylobacterium zucineum]